MLVWIGFSLLMFSYGYFRQAAIRHGWEPPAIVPAWHFYFYGLVAKAVLTGLGILLLARFLVTSAAHRIPKLGERLDRLGADAKTWVAMAIAFTALAAWIAPYIPAYLGRSEFGEEHDAALELSRRTDELQVLDWIAAHTAKDEVILAKPEIGMKICAVTGRKVVALDSIWSNPYVDGESRGKVLGTMLGAIHRSNEKDFRYWASKYRVRFIVLDPMITRRLAARNVQNTFLQEDVAAGDYRIFELLPPGELSK